MDHKEEQEEEVEYVKKTPAELEADEKILRNLAEFFKSVAELHGVPSFLLLELQAEGRINVIAAASDRAALTLIQDTKDRERIKEYLG